jgi:outer membrane receptor for ferrienterochelin and colicins
VTKRNGSAATVSGLNAELSLALGSQWVIQLGGTVQTARYDEDELIWSPKNANESNADSLIATRNLLRTPNAYGFFTANYRPVKAFNLSLSGVFTGPMDVPHVIVLDNEFTVLERTPGFLELNIKADYALPIAEDFDLHLFAGVQNVLNSYQDDFDRGPDRDAGYVYGPSRPRTVFVGLKVHLE